MNTIHDDIDKKCKGCGTYRDQNCNIVQYAILCNDMSLVSRCPCPYCMVKIICQNACQEYSEVTIESSYLEREYYNKES